MAERQRLAGEAVARAQQEEEARRQAQIALSTAQAEARELGLSTEGTVEEIRDRVAQERARIEEEAAAQAQQEEDARTLDLGSFETIVTTMAPGEEGALPPGLEPVEIVVPGPQVAVGAEELARARREGEARLEAVRQTARELSLSEEGTVEEIRARIVDAIARRNAERRRQVQVALTAAQAEARALGLSTEGTVEEIRARIATRRARIEEEERARHAAEARVVIAGPLEKAQEEARTLGLSDEGILEELRARIAGERMRRRVGELAQRTARQARIEEDVAADLEAETAKRREEEAGPAPTVTDHIRMLGSRQPEDRAQAAEALGDSRDESVIWYLNEALLTDIPSVRIAAAGSLGRLGGETAARHLMAALRGERTTSVRVAIVEALGETGSPQSLRALISALNNDQDAAVHVVAALALGRLGDRHAAEPLIARLAEPNPPPVRAAVATALGTLGVLSQAVVQALCTRLGMEPDEEVRGSIRDSLERLGVSAEQMVNSNIFALSNREPNARREAAQELERFGDRRAIPHLTRRLQDEDDAARQAAAHALEALNTPREAWVSGYSAALTTGRSPRTRGEAAAALGTLGRYAAPSGTQVVDQNVVQTLINKSGDVGNDEPEVFIAAIRAIGALGGPNAVRHLLLRPNDPNPNIRRAVVEALGGVAEHERLEVRDTIVSRLLTIRSGDLSDIVRNAAATVLARLGVRHASAPQPRPGQGHAFKPLDVVLPGIVSLAVLAIMIFFGIHMPAEHIFRFVFWILPFALFFGYILARSAELGTVSYRANRAAGLGLWASLMTPILERGQLYIVEGRGYEYLSRRYRSIIIRHEQVKYHWLGILSLYMSFYNALIARWVEEMEIKRGKEPVPEVVPSPEARTEAAGSSEPPPASAAAPGPVSGPTAGDHIRALKRRGPRDREAAAEALGGLGDQSTAGPLIEILMHDRVPSVRVAAVRALERLGNESAVEPLIRALDNDPSASVRVAIAEVFGIVETPAPTVYARDSVDRLARVNLLRAVELLILMRNNPHCPIDICTHIDEVLEEKFKSLNVQESRVNFDDVRRIAHTPAEIMRVAVLIERLPLPEEGAERESCRERREHVCELLRRAYFDSIEKRLNAVTKNIGGAYRKANMELRPSAYKDIGKGALRPSAMKFSHTLVVFFSGLFAFILCALNLREALMMGAWRGFGWSVWIAVAVFICVALFVSRSGLLTKLEYRRDDRMRRDFDNDVLEGIYRVLDTERKRTGDSDAVVIAEIKQAVQEALRQAQGADREVLNALGEILNDRDSTRRQALENFARRLREAREQRDSDVLMNVSRRLTEMETWRAEREESRIDGVIKSLRRATEEALPRARRKQKKVIENLEKILEEARYTRAEVIENFSRELAEARERHDSVVLRTISDKLTSARNKMNENEATALSNMVSELANAIHEISQEVPDEEQAELRRLAEIVADDQSPAQQVIERFGEELERAREHHDSKALEEITDRVTDMVTRKEKSEEAAFSDIMKELAAAVDDMRVYATGRHAKTLGRLSTILSSGERRLKEKGIERFGNALQNARIRQAVAVEVLIKTLRQTRRDLKRLQKDSGLSFKEWRDLTRMNVEARFPTEPDHTRVETMNIQIEDYIDYCREWLGYVKDHMATARLTTAADYFSYTTLAGDMPILYLDNEEGFFQTQRSDGNVRLMPGKEGDYPGQGGQSRYRIIGESTPHNGPIRYGRAEHPMPVVELIDHMDALEDYIGSKVSNSFELMRARREAARETRMSTTGGLDEGTRETLERAVDRTQSYTSFSHESRVRAHKGIGGAGPANSSRERMRERHRLTHIVLSIGLVILLSIGYIARQYLSSFGTGIESLPEMNLIVFAINFFAGALLLGFMNINMLFKLIFFFARYFVKREQEEAILANDIIRFVPPGILAELLQDVRKDIAEEGRRIPRSLTPLDRMGEPTEINEANACRVVENVSREYSGFYGVLAASVRNEKPSQWPLHRLYLDKNIMEIVYLANTENRTELEGVLLEMAREGHMTGWNNGTDLTPERMGELNEDRRERGDLSNLDLLEGLTLADIRYLLSKQDYRERLWPKIAIMITSFGGGMADKMERYVPSAVRHYPGRLDFFIVTDDTDKDGPAVVRQALYGNNMGIDIGPNPAATMYGYRHQVHVITIRKHGVNMETGQRKVRMKPPMNAEAVMLMKQIYAEQAMTEWNAMGEEGRDRVRARMAARIMAERGEEAWDALAGEEQERLIMQEYNRSYLPRSQELIDEEDRLGQMNLRTKVTVWAARLRAINEQLTTGRVDARDREHWGIDLDSDRVLLEGIFDSIESTFTANASNTDVGELKVLSQEEAVERYAHLDLADLPDSEVPATAARDRVTYQYWCFLQTWGRDFKTGEPVDAKEYFIRKNFEDLNMPFVIQSELRLIPYVSPSWSQEALLDYLTWHSTIQPGQTKVGFLFLGGTGNNFQWKHLAWTEALVDGNGEVLRDERGRFVERPLCERAKFQLLLRPLREAISEEETRMAHARRAVSVEEEVAPPESPREIRASTTGSPEGEPESGGVERTAQEVRQEAITVPSLIFRDNLNELSSPGVWDLYNKIEDAELGSRTAKLRMKNTRMVGKWTQILEELLPALGLGWWLQRTRWIIPQTLYVILSYRPAAWMFYGQYIGLGLFWAIFGSRGLLMNASYIPVGLSMVLQGVVMAVVGALFLYIAASVVRWLYHQITRRPDAMSGPESAGGGGVRRLLVAASSIFGLILAAATIHIPILYPTGMVGQGLIMAAVGFFLFGWLFYGLGKAFNSIRISTGRERNVQWSIDPLKTMGYFKFQATAHLAAATYASVFAAVTLIVTILYLIGNTIVSISELPISGGGLGAALFAFGLILVKYVPVIIGWVTAQTIGAVLFLYPPIAQSLMCFIPSVEQGIQNEESTNESLRMKLGVGKREYCKLPGLRVMDTYEMSSEELANRDQTGFLDNHETVLRIALWYAETHEEELRGFTPVQIEERLFGARRINERRGAEDAPRPPVGYNEYVQELRNSLQALQNLRRTLNEQDYLPEIDDAIVAGLRRIYTLQLPEEFNISDDATILRLLDDYEINARNAIAYAGARRIEIAGFTARDTNARVFGWADINEKLKIGKKELLDHRFTRRSYELAVVRDVPGLAGIRGIREFTATVQGDDLVVNVERLESAVRIPLAEFQEETQHTLRAAAEIGGTVERGVLCIRIGSDVNHYIHVMEEEVLGTELEDLRREVEGRVYIGKGTLFTGLFILSILGYLFTYGFITFGGWLGVIYFAVTLLAALWTGVGLIQQILNLSAWLSGRQAPPLLRVGRLPYHTLRLMIMAFTMVDYFNHLFISGFMNLHNMIAKKKSEAKWERGRTSVVTVVMGEKRSPDIVRKERYVTKPLTWFCNRGWLTLILLLSFIPIILTPLKSFHDMAQKQMWTSAYMATSYQPYLEGERDMSRTELKTAYDYMKKSQANDPFRRFVYGEAPEGDAGGIIRAEVDNLVADIEQGNRERAQKRWNAISNFLRYYQIDILAEVQTGMLSRKHAQGRYDYVMEHVRDGLSRAGLLDKYYEITGTTSAEDAVSLAQADTWSEEGMSNEPLRVEGNTVVVNFKLGGFTNWGGAPNQHGIVATLKKSRPMKDSEEFVFDVQIPREFAHRMIGRFVEAYAIDAKGERYKMGKEARVVISREDQRGRDLLEGRPVTLRIRPEAPSTPGFDPMLVKSFYIEIDSGVTTHADVEMLIINPRIQKRVPFQSTLKEPRPLYQAAPAVPAERAAVGDMFSSDAYVRLSQLQRIQFGKVWDAYQRELGTAKRRHVISSLEGQMRKLGIDPKGREGSAKSARASTSGISKAAEGIDAGLKQPIIQKISGIEETTIHRISHLTIPTLFLLLLSNTTSAFAQTKELIQATYYPESGLIMLGVITGIIIIMIVIEVGIKSIIGAIRDVVHAMFHLRERKYLREVHRQEEIQREEKMKADAERRAAALAKAESDSPDDIFEAARYGEYAVRSEALANIANINDIGKLDHLLALTQEHSDWGIRERAYDALFKVGTPAAIESARVWVAQSLQDKNRKNPIPAPIATRLCAQIIVREDIEIINELVYISTRQLRDSEGTISETIDFSGLEALVNNPAELMAKINDIKVTKIIHPLALEFRGDIETLKSTIKTPEEAHVAEYVIRARVQRTTITREVEVGIGKKPIYGYRTDPFGGGASTDRGFVDTDEIVGYEYDRYETRTEVEHCVDDSKARALIANPAELRRLIDEELAKRAPRPEARKDEGAGAVPAHVEKVEPAQPAAQPEEPGRSAAAVPQVEQKGEGKGSEAVAEKVEPVTSGKKPAEPTTGTAAMSHEAKKDEGKGRASTSGEVSSKRSILDVSSEEILGLSQGYAKDHMDRVARIALAIGRAMDLSEQNMNVLRCAAYGHDAGVYNAPETYEGFKRMGIDLMRSTTMGQDEFVRYAAEVKGAPLTEQEITMLDDIYRHGINFSEFLKERYELPAEVEILIRGHGNYGRFLEDIERLHDRISIPIGALKRLLSIIITADMFENGNNMFKSRTFRNKGFETFDESFTWIERTYESWGVEDTGPGEVLAGLLASRDQELLGIVSEARQGAGLTEKDEEFIRAHSIHAQTEETPGLRQSTTGSAAAAPDIVVGVPKGVFSEETFATIRAKNPGVDVVELYSKESDVMLQELERSRVNRGARSSALIDVEGITPDEAARAVAEIVQKLRSDRFDLTYPRLKVLDENAVQALRTMTAKELRRVQEYLIEGIPVIQNYRLNEKSAFDLRIHSLYRMHRTDYTARTLAYLDSLSAEKTNRRRYIATTVTNSLEMRLLAEAIRERKEAMEVTDEKEDPVADIVFVRMDNVREDTLDELLVVTGLAGLVRREDCIIIPAALTPQEAFDMVQKLYPQATAREVAVGAARETILVDRDHPDEILREMLLVQLGSSGLTSQLYKMMIDIIASGDAVPQGVSASEVDSVRGYNWFIYLPKMEAIDLRREAEAYERYVQDVLTRA